MFEGVAATVADTIIITAHPGPSEKDTVTEVPLRGNFWAASKHLHTDKPKKVSVECSRGQVLPEPLRLRS